MILKEYFFYYLNDLIDIHTLDSRNLILLDWIKNPKKVLTVFAYMFTLVCIFLEITRYMKNHDQNLHLTIDNKVIRKGVVSC